jgi:hypothetical protein
MAYRETESARAWRQSIHLLCTTHRHPLQWPMSDHRLSASCLPPCHRRPKSEIGEIRKRGGFSRGSKLNSLMVLWHAHILLALVEVGHVAPFHLLDPCSIAQMVADPSRGEGKGVRAQVSSRSRHRKQATSPPVPESHSPVKLSNID